MNNTTVGNSLGVNVNCKEFTYLYTPNSKTQIIAKFVTCSICDELPVCVCYCFSHL